MHLDGVILNLPFLLAMSIHFRGMYRRENRWQGEGMLKFADGNIYVGWFEDGAAMLHAIP